jgi:hypothetical protein
MAKAVLVIISAVFLNIDSATIESCGDLVPTITVEGSTESDSLSGKEKKKESVKISISDDGIKVEHGDKDQLILDHKKIQSFVEKGIRSIQAESLMFSVGLGREEKYSRIVKGDRVKIGNSVEVEEDELIQGSAVSVFGKLRVDGKVKGDAVCVFGDLRLGPEAVVNGDVVCVLGHLEKGDGAVVRGETIAIGSANMADVGITPPVIFPFFPFRGGVFRLMSRVVLFLGAVLLLLLIVYFIPGRLDRSADFIARDFLKSVGLGALVFVFGSLLVLIVSIIIGITIIGIPVSILMVLCYIAFLFLGYFIGAFTLGRAVSRRFNMGADSRYVQGIIGLFIIALFGFISSAMKIALPFVPVAALISLIGKFVSFLALLAGVGAFIVSRAGTAPVRSVEISEELER